MTERQHTENDAPEQSTTHRAMKRRGLIAGAAALVAGMVAKQSAQPVAADNQVWQMPYNSGVQNTSIPLMNLNNTGIGDGLVVTTIGSGIYASSNGAYGVYGNTNAPTGSSNAGVSGIGNGTGTYGVAGDGFGSGYGVYGSNGVIGVYGIPVRGTGFYGVRGDAGAPVGSAGLLGFSNTANGTAFGSVVVAPATLAGFFNGEVHVHGGAFVVDDMTMKHGTIPHPDGTKRLMYSMEAPESWTEDFGTGQLAGGKATVALDPDFAAVIHADTYHVFLTPETDTRGLYIVAKGATGFTVREQQGGTSTGAFSWRVVAKPNVGRQVERMPEYHLPFDPVQFTKTVMEQTVKGAPPPTSKKKP
ncbi:MAG: hypothetical protein ACR2M3_18740 [Thermomicrobiales bacterium]